MLQTLLVMTEVMMFPAVMYGNGLSTALLVIRLRLMLMDNRRAMLPESLFTVNYRLIITTGILMRTSTILLPTLFGVTVMELNMNLLLPKVAFIMTAIITRGLLRL
jgi:hypothetical protein